MEYLLAIIGIFVVLWSEIRSAIRRERQAFMDEDHNTRHHYTDNLHHPH